MASCRLGPVVQVVADRVHEHLRRLALGRVVAVVAGVEDVVLALALEHRAGEDELVLLVVAAARDRHAAVTVVDEVLGGGEVPAERLAERFGVAVVPLVEQEELVALAERHAITWPAKGDVATPSLMKPMMSERPRANPRASAL